ncbi:hypothetical protein GLOTRDRAFT_101830, partial [Gloeophyllum trabeum ATCC 11539]
MEYEEVLRTRARAREEQRAALQGGSDSYSPMLGGDFDSDQVIAQDPDSSEAVGAPDIMNAC